MPRVAVVGGSLGGLIAALVLRDVGCDVQVYERSREVLEGRGAGIVLHPATTRYLETHRVLDLDEVSSSTRTLRFLDLEGGVVLERPVNYRFTSYTTLYRALLGCLETERYHLASELAGLEQDADAVTVRFAGGGEERVDLLVGADGIGSTVRGILFPDVEPAYAGYVGWRGTLREEDLSDRAHAALDGAITYFVGPGTHVLSYPIPRGDDEEAAVLVNWVWYRNVPAGEVLDDLTLDREGVRHAISLPAGSVRDRHVDGLRSAAADELPAGFADLVAASPQPFVQVIVDIGVERMAVGRVCLIGDAAFALRPHIAAGTAKAAADAHALAEAIEASGGGVPAALGRWEPVQLALGRSAIGRARDLGERVQFAGTYHPSDPDVVFGLFAAGDSSFPG